MGVGKFGRLVWSGPAACSRRYHDGRGSSHQNCAKRAISIANLPIFASYTELSGPTLRFEAIPQYEIMEDTATRLTSGG